MIVLTSTLNLDEMPWSDLTQECPEVGEIERIGRLPRGTTKGKSVIAVVIRMPNGRRFLAQTTLACMHDAMLAINTAEGMSKAPGN